MAFFLLKFVDFFFSFFFCDFCVVGSLVYFFSQYSRAPSCILLCLCCFIKEAESSFLFSFSLLSEENSCVQTGLYYC